MPPRKKALASNVDAAAQSAPADTASASDSKGEPVKVQLYDQQGMKTALDDCAREAVLESGFEEDYTTSNVKIVVGLVAIGLAVYSHFGPGKFPANWWMVFFCVAAYTVLTLWLNYYLHREEGDAFLICKAKRGGAHGLRLSSRMERFDDQYTLVISQSRPGRPGYREVKSTASVAMYFHADGYLSDAAFKAEVEKLLTEFERGADKKSQ